MYSVHLKLQLLYICADEVATQKHLIWYSCWVDIYYRYVGNYIACWYIVFDFKKYYLFKNTCVN